jgi:RNA recognition motif-containing protein
MGESTGTADIEFSKHEECEEAINKLDNAEIDGVKVRVKYADFGPRTGRRVGSLSTRRRNLRAINRENRRSKTKSGSGTRKAAEKGGKSSVRTTRRRRGFRRVLGRRRK